MTGIDISSTDRVGRITVRNPKKRNAIKPSFLPELSTAIDELREDVRCLVVTGAGERAFSAGFDLSEMEGGAFHEEHESAYESVLGALAAFPYPTIAKVNGDAIGGGFDLCLSCDLRVCTTDARFGVPTAKVGIVYPERAIRRMVQTIGPTYAMELLYTADLVDATRADEMGFVTDAVPAEDLDDRTADLASTIVANAPRTLATSKRIVRAVQDQFRLTPTQQEFVERERTAAFESDDVVEGWNALSEGREPDFTGE